MPFSLSPNPATSSLDIEIVEDNSNTVKNKSSKSTTLIDNENYSFSIYEQTMQERKKVKTKYKKTKVNVSDLKKGVYFVVLKTDKNTYVEKLIIE